MGPDVQLRGRVGELRVLLVGIGGLGCPAALALAEAGVGTLVIADDDEVDATNLHRQILFEEADVGLHKVDAAVAALARRYPETRFLPRKTRFLPHLALELLEGIDVVVEGSDNFPTKFLVADACALAQKPVVHGAALRWLGTVLAVGPRQRPCYRCIFEDLPPGDAPSCADAGVIGPVCGVVGALMADLALSLGGAGQARAAVDGLLVTFDGKRLSRRSHHLRARAACELCGEGARGPELSPLRYVGNA